MRGKFWMMALGLGLAVSAFGASAPLGPPKDRAPIEYEFGDVSKGREMMLEPARMVPQGGNGALNREPWKSGEKAAGVLRHLQQWLRLEGVWIYRNDWKEKEAFVEKGLAPIFKVAGEQLGFVDEALKKCKADLAGLDNAPGVFRMELSLWEKDRERVGELMVFLAKQAGRDDWVKGYFEKYGAFGEYQNAADFLEKQQDPSELLREDLKAVRMSVAEEKEAREFLGKHWAELLKEDRMELRGVASMTPTGQTWGLKLSDGTLRVTQEYVSVSKSGGMVQTERTVLLIRKEGELKVLNEVYPGYGVKKGK